MSTFKIATWNVNSLRVRLPHVLSWLADVQPDVLALQETKTPNEGFPYPAFSDAGYTAIASGQKAYNGVALISRTQPTDIVTDIPGLDDVQRRILSAVINNIRIVDLYVPNGESIVSAKYQYKLHWLKNVDLYLQAELQTHSQVIVLGDFNIAPQAIDVHNPAAWEGQVLFSQPERDAFADMLKMGFSDCYRMLNPDEKNYSWWDYRLNAFKRNMGLRIDHVIASHSLAAKCIKCTIDKLPRSWERPSDHAPVIAEFDLT